MPTPSETYIQNRERIQPNQTNNYDTAHGGIVMHLMDEIGAMSAMRFAGETCVTARVESLDFKRPIPRGDTAVVEAWVYETGRTSVKVRIRVDREDPRTGDSARTSDSTFTFVSVDTEGNPQPVPDLAVETDRDRRLRGEGRAEHGDA
jgi:uncharacterized protein (TIGR00369 family)